jgi:hypothetical protein
MVKRKQREPERSQKASFKALHTLSCRLAGVPDGSEAPSQEQIRTAIHDLAAKRAGIPREALDAMSKEERLQIIEANMPQNAEELARLIAEEWTHRVKEAAQEIMEKAASVAAAASSIRAEDAGLETYRRNSGKAEVGICRGAMARLKERFGDHWRDVLRDDLRCWERQFKEETGYGVWEYQGGGPRDESMLMGVVVGRDKQPEAVDSMFFQIPGHGRLPHLYLPEEWRHVTSQPDRIMRRAAWLRLHVSYEEFEL